MAKVQRFNRITFIRNFYVRHFLLIYYLNAGTILYELRDEVEPGTKCIEFKLGAELPITYTAGSNLNQDDLNR